MRQNVTRRFRCPNCGGHLFGTFYLPNGKEWHCCRNELPRYNQFQKVRGCDFIWPETDSFKYFIRKRDPK